MSEQQVRPAAMRVFETKFKPFIRQEFMKAAPLSYLTENQLKTINWRTQFGYDESVAQHLEFQSKMFFSFAFKQNDPRRFDMDILADLTDMMAAYLAPYFRQQTPGMSKADAAAYLKRVLFTENKYIIRNKAKNDKIAQKHALRDAARAVQEQAEIERANAPRKKRIRIITNKYNQTVCAIRINLEQQKQK